MTELFLKILNMSISAGWIVLAVLFFRLVLKKAPKWVNVLLWGIVGIRLICPFSIESALSLIPSAETVSPEIMMDRTPAIQTGVSVINNMINPVISNSFTPNPGVSANPLQILIPIFAAIWVLGAAVLLLYTAVSYWRLKSKISTAIPLRENIYQSENVGSPFVLGILKPKIYLPFHMGEQDLNHVIAHEQAHIRRKDHWWKPIGFLLLTIYWFNPLIWLAYALLCRDIELACDEKVIRELDNEQRAYYTQALLSCSVNHRMITACPLAFGEVGVKERVKSVMNYRKPTFWVVTAAIIICIAAAVCFLTNPPKQRETYEWAQNLSAEDYPTILVQELGKDEFEEALILYHKNPVLNGSKRIITLPDQNDLKYYQVNIADEGYSEELPIEEEIYFATDESNQLIKGSYFVITEPKDLSSRQLKYLNTVIYVDNYGENSNKMYLSLIVSTVYRGIESYDFVYEPHMVVDLEHLEVVRYSPQPMYVVPDSHREDPLNKQEVSDAMAACDFPKNLTIEEQELLQSPGIESASYTLRFDNKDIYVGKCLGILSRCKGENHSLGINFTNLDQSQELSEEECKQAIIFATRLFGEFTDETQVYDEFQSVFNLSEVIEWESNIGGIDCQIKYDPELPSEVSSRLLIAFANDMEDFYQSE